MKSELIGKVKLNLDYYSGRENLSDSQKMDFLLDVAKKYDVKELNSLIAQSKDYDLLYHFSHVRQNVISWMPISKTDTVLEIDSECGAITGALVDKAKHVTCIDASLTKSQINATRHQNNDNLEIIVGELQDILKDLNEKYNYIFVSSNLHFLTEWDSDAENFQKLLSLLKGLLSDNGIIVFATDNQFGLKYFAGAKDFITKKYFDSIEGYNNTNSSRFFSKGKIEEMSTVCGFDEVVFYYPYPDYVFPMAIYSDEYLPSVGELTAANYNFDDERMTLIDEEKAYDAIIQDHMFPQFSNSYLVIMS